MHPEYYVGAAYIVHMKLNSLLARCPRLIYLNNKIMIITCPCGGYEDLII